jgi:hypothetical protein
MSGFSLSTIMHSHRQRWNIRPEAWLTPFVILNQSTVMMILKMSFSQYRIAPGEIPKAMPRKAGLWP